MSFNLKKINKTIEEGVKEIEIRIKMANTPMENYLTNFREIYNTDPVKQKFGLVQVNKFTNKATIASDIQEAKKILTDAIARLDGFTNTMQSNLDLSTQNKFGSRLGASSQIFKDLIHSGKINSTTEIYGYFSRQEYTGFILSDGYFYLNLENGYLKRFSSLTTAASFILRKPAGKGETLWYAKDKDGEEHPLAYYIKKFK